MTLTFAGYTKPLLVIRIPRDPNYWNMPTNSFTVYILVHFYKIKYIANPKHWWMQTCVLLKVIEMFFCVVVCTVKKSFCWRNTINVQLHKKYTIKSNYGRLSEIWWIYLLNVKNFTFFYIFLKNIFYIFQYNGLSLPTVRFTSHKKKVIEAKAACRLCCLNLHRSVPRWQHCLALLWLSTGAELY